MDLSPLSAQAGGWHKDGWMFRHFLDSAEQGLLVLVIYNDIVPGNALFSGRVE